MERRHDLDWLRVILFALLVPHHVAVGFVPWGADVYGFTHGDTAGEGLSLFIYWSHSWRLPSLFLVAGIGTWFLTRRGAGARALGARLARLLVPVVFGVVALNAVGGYAMARMTGTPPGFLAFWAGWLAAPVPRHVQHLWFLVNLALYTLLLWPVVALRPRLPPMPVWLLLAGLVALAAVPVAVFKPFAPAIAGDAYQWPYYLAIFAGGIAIGARHAEVLAWVERRAWWLLAGAAAVFAVKVGLLADALARDAATGAALARGGWVPLGLVPRWGTAFSVVEAATAWAWCLAALGLAARYLNRPGARLQELARGVFPLYVLHFPLTLGGLALVAQTALPWQVAFPGLTALVLAGSWLLWRGFDRLGPIGVLVGGRARRAAARPAEAGR